MKKFIVIMILLICNSAYCGFIHPLDFHGSETQKQDVISYIKMNMHKTYSNIGLGNPTTLRMMEAEELRSFKELTKSRNRSLLDRVINTYCSVGLCSYQNLLMMYNEELKASNNNLTW